jgi:light-regulated signal transduction histidine kinase (bacteriophytochrome)
MIKSYNIVELRAAFFDKAYESFLLMDKDLFILDVSKDFLRTVQIQKSNVEISEDFSNCLAVQYNKIQKHGLMHNLLTNAIKYRLSDIKCTIEFKTELIQGRTMLSVRENGLGFDLNSDKNEILSFFKRIHTHVEGFVYREINCVLKWGVLRSRVNQMKELL